jgi:hypothetical protein
VPTGLNYSQYVTQIATMAVVEPSDPAFVTILPAMIDYAELRIYRDLDLLSTVTTSTSYTLSASDRRVTFPASAFVSLQQVNVITPAGSSDPDSATRVSLMPATKEFLDAVYPSATGAAVPKYFAMLNATTVLVGPWPSSAYTVELVGTTRPATLSAANTTTVISTQLPDLLIMASMIYISGFQRNFGRASDQPDMAVSYESQYQGLLKGAMVEEFRKKFQSGGWTSFSPSPIATPTRG